MTVLGLAGDTMLGRGVARALEAGPPERLFSPELVAVAHEADVLVVNLECCISSRGSPWPAPGKPFFFRAPPAAVDALQLLGVDAVTLANNHALDFGVDALLDTVDLLSAAGIAATGAGADAERARDPATLSAGGLRIGLLSLTDHPADFAAGPGTPGVAFADLRNVGPDWSTATVAALSARCDLTVVAPHWGPNMVAEPVPHVRRAARAFLDAGADLVAGHSAHVFQGVSGRVLYDLGDFVDDYAVDPDLRNDLGIFVLVELDERGPARLVAVPIALDFCHTRLALGEEADWVAQRFRAACRDLGTEARVDDGRLVVDLREGA